MPAFDQAVSSRTTGSIDLAPYRDFLSKYEPGTSLTVPLEPGERSRLVAHALNIVAAEQGKRLRRVFGGAANEFRFVIIRPGRRGGGLTAEQIEQRVAKAKATRAANKARRAAEA